MVHAPTPTDEPLSLPALLLASFPLSPDRRHVAPGPLTDFLVERAADAYAGLLPLLPAGPACSTWCPGRSASGELDARLGRAIVARLPDVPFLPAVTPREAGTRDSTAGYAVPDADQGSPGEQQHAPAGDGPHPRRGCGRGTRCCSAAAAPGLAELLAPVLPHLVDGPPRHPAWAVLGVRRMPLAELADLLAALGREPAWWRGLYAALAGRPSPGRRNGPSSARCRFRWRTGGWCAGRAGCCCPAPGSSTPASSPCSGCGWSHPEAAHPLLARLGAVEATPRGALEDPATRAAVATSYDRAVEAVLRRRRSRSGSPTRCSAWSRAVGAEPGDYPWLADLALPGDDGDWYPAGELLLPGSPLAEIVAGDAPFGTIGTGLRHGTARHPGGGRRAVHLRAAEGGGRELDESAADLDLDGADDWAADTRDRLRQPAAGLRCRRSPSSSPPSATSTWSTPDRWPRALELLTRPPLRAALTEPARVRLPDGRHADVPSYTAWWLRRHLTLGGRRPAELRAPDADPLLAGLYDAAGPPGPTPMPTRARPRARRPRRSPARSASGPRSPRCSPSPAARTSCSPGSPTRPGRSPGRSCGRCGRRSRPPTGLTPDDVTPPDRVRAVLGDELVVADADDVLVLDAPDLWPLAADRPLVLAPYQHAARLADLLDLPLASEEIPGVVKEAGELPPGARRAA